MAASWNGGTAPEAAVNRASRDQSRMAPEPIRVAERIVMDVALPRPALPAHPEIG